MNIKSNQNPKVKFWLSLKNKKSRDQNQCFLIEGNHLIQEARKHNLLIETISINEDGSDFIITKEIMKKISSQETISAQAAVVKYLTPQDIKGQVLILDALQDPGNLGTIIRSAVAFGFTTVILSCDSVDLYNPKVIRSTVGMLFNINVIRTNLKDIIPTLKEKGYLIVATDVKEGQNIKNLASNKLAIIIGNEGKGINKDIKKMATSLVKINMNKACESLNAAVAATILMYEVSQNG